MNNNINSRSRRIEDVVMWYADDVVGPRVSKHVYDYTGFLPADWTLVYVPIR